MKEEPLSSSSPLRHTKFYVLSTSASDSFFQDHLNVIFPSRDPDLRAEGSSENSVHNPSPADDTTSCHESHESGVGMSHNISLKSAWNPVLLAPWIFPAYVYRDFGFPLWGGLICVYFLLY